MTDAQRRAVASHRERMSHAGLGRFEVRGLNSDKELLRTVAKRLAQDGASASTLRAQLNDAVADQDDSPGAIYRAMRRAPHVELDIARDEADDRVIEL